MTRVVVVGNGMAGSRLVHEMRARDPHNRLDITVFGAEPHAAYNRILLSNVLAGTTSADSIRMTASEPVPDRSVDVRTGVAVKHIDRTSCLVEADDGTTTPYDVLVLATGSRAVVPPIPGLRTADGDLRAGAGVFRTLADCERIVALASAARSAVVLGGGLLGLEAARGLAGRGLAVTVVHRPGHLMERQLDGGAAAVLTRTLQTLGVSVRVDRTTVAVHGDDAVSSVELDSGERLAADVLVVACGVEPETRLARDCGLQVETGIVVDDQLRTSDPRVFAIGECAQHAGCVYGLVAPAWEQAAVVADVLTGSDTTRYRGSRLVTRLKAAGVELAAMGETQPSVADDHGSDEVLQFVDPARGTYKKVVIRDNRLVGAILLGDVATVGTVTQLFDRGAQVPGDRLALLFRGLGSAADVAESPVRMPDRATVCRCNGVTKRAITTCWLDGARTVDAIASRTRATTGCGTCRDVVEGIVDWLATTDTTERSSCA